MLEGLMVLGEVLDVKWCICWKWYIGASLLGLMPVLELVMRRGCLLDMCYLYAHGLHCPNIYWHDPRDHRAPYLLCQGVWPSMQ